jgi:large subunit ribosomal protein L22
MKAFLSNYRQAPRKVRLVANAIKGKTVGQAELELRFMVKRAALPLEKLLASAVANAVNQSGLNKDDLIIKEIRVDKGIVLKRSMPRAFGRASAINKRSSHVTIVLAVKGEKETTKKGKKSKAPAVVEAKPKKAVKKAITPKKKDSN